MERVKYKGERFLIQTFGQPTAVIISVEEYDKMANQTQLSMEPPIQRANVRASQEKQEVDSSRLAVKR
jgi:PHD/YefM family antitoxin component YafN of YafNO toxin-antitoxin module